MDVCAAHTGGCVQYAGEPATEFAKINVDVIYPCTAKHISKYSQQKSGMLCETPAMYTAVTEPHIAAIPPAATSWVINILEKKKEADRMIFEDPDPVTGFMLHPDLKWDRTQVRPTTASHSTPRCQHRSDRAMGSCLSTLGTLWLPGSRNWFLAWGALSRGSRRSRGLGCQCMAERRWTSCTASRWCTAATSAA